MALNILELLGITNPSTLTIPMQRAILSNARGVNAPRPTPTPDPNSFGMGKEIANIEPALFDAIMALKATEEERRNIAELTGQESSYGYAGPHLTDKEQSYGPVHINVASGRINPETGKPFTKEEAIDIDKAIQYALDEYRRTEGLGSWNPGAYPLYQYGIPRRARTKKYVRGKK